MTSNNANDAQNLSLWKDLIDIPQRRSTFVLKLSEGIERAQETVKNYVVTDSLAGQFDQALSLILTALDTKQDQGAFLHGSFGSGKSHFMAMLNLLLQGFQPARAIHQLTDVVVKHGWMKDKKLLMIPYHMLGATSIEAAVLGGYVDYIEKHHPEARIPGVFVGGRVLENAESLRASMGDDAFFTQLNAGNTQPAGDGWGTLGAQWDLDSYTQALNASPRSATYEKLVGDVVRTILPSVRDTARVAQESQYISFDEGLAVIARHAHELNYDGLILFLDELILWLSGKSADPKFLRNELEKIPKLVESQHAGRPIPIISFIARQRDLRDMLGDAMMGEERGQMDLSLEWWQGRFHTIELEDRNLPQIAAERLLAPRNVEARERIQQSFDQFLRGLKKNSRDTMLSTKYNETDFARVYPFSPALVESLIVLSSTLQRDRTALKLMQALLIERRDSLRLGDIIPVGDLWDVISEGGEPMNAMMKKMMQNAQTLWQHRLYPMLVREYKGVDPTDPATHADPHTADRFRDDARLLKTLLIAALLPSIEIFQKLSVRRLIDLNYGSVRAPIPGAETSVAVQKLRNWSTSITELTIDTSSDPLVSLRLESIDIEPMLRKADSIDNLSNRRNKIKSLLYEWLELNETPALRAEYKLNWRGARRTLHINYGNVREMSHERLTANTDHWQIIFDYPFDEDHNHYSPADDRAALDQYLETWARGTHTIAWLPTFFDEQGKELIGQLLKIEDVLARFDTYAANLSQENRDLARVLLKNARSTVRDRLQRALHAAYGLVKDSTNLLDLSTNFDDHLFSLKRGFTPTLPFGKSFKEALEDIAREALAARYPDAYRLPDEPLKSREVEQILDIVRTAIEDENRRAPVDHKPFRQLMRQWAEPLKLGRMGDTHFVYHDIWRNQINQALSAGSKPIRVADIYALLDPEDPENPGAHTTGLPNILKDLIVLSYAAIENRYVSHQGHEVDASPGSLKPQDLLELRHLPDPGALLSACNTIEAVFQLTPPKTRNARSIQLLADLVRQAAQPHRTPALQVPDRLIQVGSDHLGMAYDVVQASARYKIADLARALMLASELADHTSLIEAIARLDLDRQQAAAIRAALTAAPKNLALLNDASLWHTLHKLASKSEPSPADLGLLSEVHQTLESAEHAQALLKLRDLEKRIIDLAFDAPAARPPTTAPPTAAPPTAPPAHITADHHTAAREHTRPRPARTFTGTRAQVTDWLNAQLQDAEHKTIKISLEISDADAPAPAPMTEDDR